MARLWGKEAMYHTLIFVSGQLSLQRTTARSTGSTRVSTAPGKGQVCVPKEVCLR